MFSLRSAAARFQDDLFQPWDAVAEEFLTGEEEGLRLRLFRVDRFTTIYHRPTRRRQLTVPPGVTLPASNVVKHVSTGDVYILSATVRQDAQQNTAYDMVVSSHLATSPSGGLFTQYRPTTSGPADDPGAAELDEVAKVYCDVELRTTADEPHTIDEAIGHFLLTLPDSAGASDGDWFVGDFGTYKVVEFYKDGGFSGARAIKQPFDLMTVTYYFDTEAGGSYNTTTGEFTPVVTEPKNISAIVSVNKEIASVSPYSEIWTGKMYISVSHITWAPKVSDSIASGGIRYKILSVVKGKSGVQWELDIEQWQGHSQPPLGS